MQTLACLTNKLPLSGLPYISLECGMFISGIDLRGKYTLQNYENGQI
jgi:hypothetical protein